MPAIAVNGVELYYEAHGSGGPRAAGARWLVRAAMMIADLPGMRGRHRQPRMR